MNSETMVGPEFLRNIGVNSEQDQEKLRQTRVAVAGAGGVGGLHTLTLARLGVGRFVIADPDTFDVVNISRQFGASHATLGRNKAEVLGDMVRDINPRAEVRVLPVGVSPDNVADFLDDVQVYVDGVDFFEIDVRRLIFNSCRDRGIFAVTAAPLGYGATLQTFDPKGMGFDEYFDISDTSSYEEKVAAFAAGLAPVPLHVQYMDFSRVSMAQRTGPAVAPGCTLATSLLATEVVKIITGKGEVRPVPHYLQFDMLLGRFETGSLPQGGKDPEQQAKRAFIMEKFALGGKEVTTMSYLEILDEAVRAPSGDNCQPWRFTVNGDEIRIFNLPERDVSLFNYRQRACYVAHGALLENLELAAGCRGYRCTCQLFPDAGQPDLVATVRLAPDTPRQHPLQPFIATRTTNRRRYNGRPLAPEARKALLASVGQDLPVSLWLTETPADQKALAAVVSVNDRLIFENPNLHAFLFDHVRWTPQEAEETADGMDLRTLELSFPDTMMFPMLKSWSLVSFLNNFGVSRIIGANAYKLAMSAGALGILNVPGDGAEDFVTLGRALQRVWLEATRQGLSFQMMTGITFLMGRVVSGATEGLSEDQVRLLAETREKAPVLKGQRGASILFRVGTSQPPTALSIRMPSSKLVR